MCQPVINLEQRDDADNGGIQANFSYWWQEIYIIFHGHNGLVGDIFIKE